MPILEKKNVSNQWLQLISQEKEGQIKSKVDKTKEILKIKEENNEIEHYINSMKPKACLFFFVFLREE